MVWEPKSIEEQIECLARLTGAPESFVGQVKVLFLNKGIALDEDATPYVNALEEAFRREEAIRAGARRTRENVTRLQGNVGKIGRAYVRQIERLKKIQAGLRGAPGPLRRIEHTRAAATEVSIPGDHRSFVTRLEQEHMPMVPGPSDPQ